MYHLSNACLRLNVGFRLYNGLVIQFPTNDKADWTLLCIEAIGKVRKGEWHNCELFLLLLSTSVERIITIA